MTTTVEEKLRAATTGCKVHGELKHYNLVPVYECRAILFQDASGRVVARVKRLPDVTTQGDSEEDAMAKIVVAFRDRIATCLRSGVSIPWQQPSEDNQGAKERWVSVSVGESIFDISLTETSLSSDAVAAYRNAIATDAARPRITPNLLPSR